ncbi:MAG: D-alanine--D-alanine ligase, partial [Planctomycetes bacterium]|nr:D-alanine--D-alanine ligase [Planctomycetota bacterium]
KGKTRFILPAPMSAEMLARVEEVGRRALNACGCEGYGRVDMILTEKGPILLEINTLPGMTETSDLPAQAAPAGMSFDQLVAGIVGSALR